MTLRDHLTSLVSALPDGASVTLPANVLRSWLADDEHSGAHSADTATTGVDYTVQQVAAKFGKGESTIRTWIAAGDLPGAYKLHGAEWRIPLAAIEAMQSRQAQQHTAPKPRTARRVADLGEWRKHAAGAR